MSSNAVVLSPYRSTIGEDNNEFQSLELERATLIPLAETNHVRLAGGPAAYETPNLTIRGESGDAQYIFPNPRQTVANPTTLLTSSGTFVFNGQTGQYTIWTNGSQATITWFGQWSSTTGSTGRIRINFPEAPKPLLANEQTGIFHLAQAGGSQMAGCCVGDVTAGFIGSAGVSLQLFGINAPDGALVDLLGPRVKSAGTTTGTMTYVVNPADLGP